MDWRRNKQLLIDGSDKAIRAFLSQHENDQLCAIGYVFELWNNSPQFDLCANTQRYFCNSLSQYKQKTPPILDDDVRWNSGDYEFPAGLLHREELGAEWLAESARLHSVADEDKDSNAVYDGLIQIGCEAIAELAKRGLFGDYANVDFNVAEVGDDVELVKQRDREIRAMIQVGA